MRKRLQKIMRLNKGVANGFNLQVGDAELVVAQKKKDVLGNTLKQYYLCGTAKDIKEMLYYITHKCKEVNK